MSVTVPKMPRLTVRLLLIQVVAFLLPAWKMKSKPFE